VNVDILAPSSSFYLLKKMYRYSIKAVLKTVYNKHDKKVSHEQTEVTRHMATHILQKFGKQLLI